VVKLILFKSQGHTPVTGTRKNGPRVSITAATELICWW